MGNQLQREYAISEHPIFRGGVNQAYDVYSGVHKETKEQVSIWRCKIPPLRMKYKNEWSDVYEMLKKEIDYLYQLSELPEGRYFLAIKNKYVAKNELIFISEPVVGTLEQFVSKGAVKLKKLEYELKFNYLVEGLKKLHTKMGVTHNNVGMDSILVTSHKKNFKLSGFAFFTKKGQSLPYERLYRKKFKPSFMKKPDQVMKREFNSPKFDMRQLKVIIEKILGGKMGTDQNRIMLMKKIIEEEEYKKPIKELNAFCSKLYHTRFDTDIFTTYIKNFLLGKVHVRNISSLEFVLPLFFKYIPELNKQQFSSLILPRFKVIFGKEFFKNQKIPLLLLNKLELFLNYTNEVEKQNVIYPFLIECLDSNQSDIQFEVLRKSEINVNNGQIDKVFFQKKVLPKIITLVRITTYPNVKLNSIVCIGKVINLLKKQYLVEKILPILKYSIRNERSAVTIMTIVGVYSRISRILDVNLIATNILPNVVPHVVSSTLKKQEFVKFMKVVRKLVDRVEKEKIRQFDELDDIDVPPPRTTSRPVNRGSRQQPQRSTLPTPDEEFNPDFSLVDKKQKPKNAHRKKNGNVVKRAPPKKSVPPTPPPKSAAEHQKKFSVKGETFNFITQAKRKSVEEKKKKDRKPLDFSSNIFEEDFSKKKKVNSKRDRRNKKDDSLFGEDDDDGLFGKVSLDQKEKDDFLGFLKKDGKNVPIKKSNPRKVVSRIGRIKTKQPQAVSPNSQLFLSSSPAEDPLGGLFGPSGGSGGAKKSKSATEKAKLEDERKVRVAKQEEEKRRRIAEQKQKMEREKQRQTARLRERKRLEQEAQKRDEERERIRREEEQAEKQRLAAEERRKKEEAERLEAAKVKQKPQQEQFQTNQGQPVTSPQPNVDDLRYSDDQFSQQIGGIGIVRSIFGGGMNFDIIDKIDEAKKKKEEEPEPEEFSNLLDRVGMTIDDKEDESFFRYGQDLSKTEYDDLNSPAVSRGGGNMFDSPLPGGGGGDGGYFSDDDDDHKPASLDTSNEVKSELEVDFESLLANVDDD